jgi:hypothetical protein
MGCNGCDVCGSGPPYKGTGFVLDPARKWWQFWKLLPCSACAGTGYHKPGSPPDIQVGNHRSQQSYVWEFDVDDLIMSATSYYLGRRTALVSEHCERLVVAWPSLPEHVRDYIKRIVEEAFRRDDIARKNRTQILPLGENCDRSAWESVRECWAGYQGRSTVIRFGGGI